MAEVGLPRINHLLVGNIPAQISQSSEKKFPYCVEGMGHFFTYLFFSKCSVLLKTYREKVSSVFMLKWQS